MLLTIFQVFFQSLRKHVKRPCAQLLCLEDQERFPFFFANFAQNGKDSYSKKHVVVPLNHLHQNIHYRVDFVVRFYQNGLHKFLKNIRLNVLILMELALQSRNQQIIKNPLYIGEIIARSGRKGQDSEPKVEFVHLFDDIRVRIVASSFMSLIYDDKHYILSN